MKYWLMKTEPSAFSWDDLKARPGQTESWDGVRNYQARNFMRDMRLGDGILFYHSVAKPTCIMGIATVARTAYPDPSQFDRSSKYFDPKSTPDNPRWDMVDVQYDRDFLQPVTLDEMRSRPDLQEMLLLRKGSRLSVQPVSRQEWKIVLKMGGG